MSSRAVVQSALKVERELHAALECNGVAPLYQWGRRYGQWLLDVAKGRLPAAAIEQEARFLDIEARLAVLETDRPDKAEGTK